MKRDDARQSLLIDRVLAACATIVALALSVEVRSQEPSPDWKSGLDKADAAYFDEVDAAADRRGAALRKAGGIWVRTIESEIEDASRKGSVDLAKSLRTKLQAKRDGGEVPLAKPADVVLFQRHQYALIREGKTWQEAKRHCERMGGHLLILDSQPEEEFVLSNWSDTLFFVGAESLKNPGSFDEDVRTAPSTYLWLDGDPFQPFSRKVEFDNNGGRQTVICWLPKLKRWDDTEDGSRLAYVCEWE